MYVRILDDSDYSREVGRGYSEGNWRCAVGPDRATPHHRRSTSVARRQRSGH